MPCCVHNVHRTYMYLSFDAVKSVKYEQKSCIMTYMYEMNQYPYNNITLITNFLGLTQISL